MDSFLQELIQPTTFTLQSLASIEITFDLGDILYIRLEMFLRNPLLFKKSSCFSSFGRKIVRYQHAYSLPAPFRVTFDTNPDDCNFRCIMCEQHSIHSPHQKDRIASGLPSKRMDISIVRNVVAEMVPLGLREIIPTTMGEPLMFKHFDVFIDLCKEFNIKLNLTTNGSFYSRGVDTWARLLAPVCCDVKISWNGITKATQEEIMINSDFNKQVSNLESFISIRNDVAARGLNYCGVTLQTTFMERNLMELPELVAFAIEKGCDRVKGHHLWVNFSEIKGEDIRRSNESRLRWNTIVEKCVELAKGKIELVNFTPLSVVGDIYENISAKLPLRESNCPFLGKEAWIDASGTFNPCCAPNEERKVLGDFGKVTEKGGLGRIWESEQYRMLVDTYKDNALCQRCTMRK